MFSTDFIFRQQENLVDNQKCQAGFRPLCNKIPFPYTTDKNLVGRVIMKISLFHVDFVTKLLKIIQQLILTHYRRNSLTKVTLRSC